MSAMLVIITIIINEICLCSTSSMCLERMMTKVRRAFVSVDVRDARFRMMPPSQLEIKFDLCMIKCHL